MPSPDPVSGSESIRAPDPITLAPVETASLPSGQLTVFATERGRNANEGRALIGSTRPEAITYVAGALLPGGARLIEIGSDDVVLEQAGTRYRVATASPAHAMAPIALTARPDPDSSITPARARATTQDSISKVLRLAAQYQDSQLTGYALYPGSDAAHFEQIGLKPGDVLTGIDGESFADPQRTGSLLRALASGFAQSLTIQRAGESSVLVIPADLVGEANAADVSLHGAETSAEGTG